MPEVKTKPTELSVHAYLENVHNFVRRADARAVRAPLLDPGPSGQTHPESGMNRNLLLRQSQD